MIATRFLFAASILPLVSAGKRVDGTTVVSEQDLVRKQNEFKVTLSQLEDDLLAQLAAADPATIPDNMPLIEGLEKTKATSAEINEQVLKSWAIVIELLNKKQGRNHSQIMQNCTLGAFFRRKPNVIDRLKSLPQRRRRSTFLVSCIDQVQPRAVCSFS